MSIIGSVSRYLKTYGRLMYADPKGFGVKPASLRRKKKSARAVYFDLLEPRVLMTTVYGGDSFQYTDALGNAVTVTLRGNVIAELVSAVQVGGGASNNESTGGYLMFADIAGTFTGGDRNEAVIGNGSLPVNNGTQGVATSAGGRIIVPGVSYPSPANNQTYSQMNLQTLASNVSGQTFTFNIFDYSTSGSLRTSDQDAQSTAHNFAMQVIQLNTSTMRGSVVYTIDSDTEGTLLPMYGNPLVDTTLMSDTEGTYTYTEVGVRASAFNPIDNKLYFEFHYRLEYQPGSGEEGGGGGEASTANFFYVDQLYSFDPTHPDNGFTEVGAVDALLNTATPEQPRYTVTGMTFSLNASAPSTATLFMSEEPNGVTGSNPTTPLPRIVTYAVAAGGAIQASDGTLVVNSTFNIYEGYGDARSTLTNVLGLAAIPSPVEGGGAGTLFALVGSGESTRVVRLDLSTVANGSANGTAWGKTTDLYEDTVDNNGQPQLVDGVQVTLDGQNLVGFTWNPAIISPFSGQFGEFMSIDAGTTNLDFINHKLRVSAGDVYAVYTTMSDINASIAFQGSNLYSGDSGTVGSTETPGNTGTVYIGYKGQVPANSTSGEFVSTTPYLTGQIVGNLGVLPGKIEDTTNPLLPGAPTDKLFAGLDVTKTLQMTLNASANLMDQTLGSTFNNISGMAIAPDGTIAVVNSFNFNGQTSDRLAFVDPTSGQIDSTIYNVMSNVGTPLKGLQALAYADPNLDGSWELYAVYDLGNGSGPTLGTLSVIGANEVFTPISALGLGPTGGGSHARVSAIGFTPTGSGSPARQSLYVVADPHDWDFDNTEILYNVNMTFNSEGALTAVRVANRPGYDGIGNVAVDSGGNRINGGLGRVRDASGNGLDVVSIAFDPTGLPLVLDRKTGRLMDLNLSTGVAGVNLATGAGQINPTVAAVALDPATLKFLVVDNLTGLTGAVDTTTTIGTGQDAHQRSFSGSSILMQLKDFTVPNAAAQSLGRFLVDGTISGKITVPGSMDLLYAGWFMTGAAATSWMVPETVAWGTLTAANATDNVMITRLTDSTANNNYFRNNIFVGGDLRNVYCLTSMGTSGTLPTNAQNEITSDIPNGVLTGLEIYALGKIGVVYTKKTFAGVVHAGNQNFVPGLIDATPLVLGGSSYDGYNFNFRGSATGTSGYIVLTDGGTLEAGSAFSNNTQPITNFTASFTAYVSSTTVSVDGGFAFVLQNQGVPALGSSGNGLGYQGIRSSAALGFTIDPTTYALNMQLLVNGTAASTVTPLSTLLTGSSLNVGMTYASNKLLVTVGGQTVSYSVNLSTILNSNTGYVGFTGSSGTGGSFLEVDAFIFNGYSSDFAQVAQSDIQHYTVDDDFTFAGGYLACNGSNAPFDNISFATAQYLGTVRNAAAGQSDSIHVAGVLEGEATDQDSPKNQLVDYFQFSVLAGQTVQVSVTPRTELNPDLATAEPEQLAFAIYDPDGNMIASSFNWLGSTYTLGRALEFTADRPGNYRVAIGYQTNYTMANSGTNPGNVSYDLMIKGVGSMGIGAVAGGGQIILTGSEWIANSTQNMGSAIINPSIWADTGDVGIVQAGANGTATTVQESIIGYVWTLGLGSLTTSGGYQYTGESSQDIFVPNGNLRGLVGGQIGGYWVADGQTSVDYGPDVYVSGAVGLIQTSAGSPQFALSFSKPAGGDIQVLNVGEGSGTMGYSVSCYIRTNQAIGVLRAGAVTGNVMLHVDVDRTGSDGVIDLIDDAGVWDGAPIVSGPGGNVRYMRVGGTLYQDPYFETTSSPSNEGGFVYEPGKSVTVTDDSGASITLTPASFSATSTSGTTTTLGQLTIWKYGIRGAGGYAIAKVQSTTGLTVTASPGGTGRNVVDIGTIVVGGGSVSGTALTVTNGVPSNGTTSGGALDVRLSSSGGAVVNVLDVRAGTLTGEGATTSNLATINTISNTTIGDILYVEAGDVGVISTGGNLGMAYHTTGAELVLNQPFGGGTFPFTDLQTAGMNVGQVGQIQAGYAIGNILASGAVGSIKPNTSGSSDPNTSYGLNGIVLVTGGANATSNITTIVNGVTTTQTLTTSVSITTVDIGQGIGYMGSATTPRTGIYASGRIQVVSSSREADIRGNVVSNTSIGTVSLTNGSIINSNVAVFTQHNMVDATFNNVTITLPTTTTIITQPRYVIDSINIQGQGGILSSYIAGSSINNITVGANGFGIIYSVLAGVDIGTIHSISVGGYGIQSTTIFDARVQAISATGSGAVLPLSTWPKKYRPSETNLIDPVTGVGVNALTDLPMWFMGDGVASLPVWWGLTSGVLGADTVYGKETLGTVSAYAIYDSSFTFPESTGAINVRGEVVDSQFISGNIASVTVMHDALTMEVTAAGQIGPVFIGGDFAPGTNQGITLLSQIEAKGPNGNIKSVTINGNLGGALLAESSMGPVTIGTKGQAGTGDVTGTITVKSNRLTTTSLGVLTVYGSLLEGSTVDLSGNITTVDIWNGVSSLSNGITIHGNLTNLKLGSDPTINGSDFGGRLSVSGNLTTATIVGGMTGQIVVGGNLGTVAVNSDPVTAGTDLFAGDISVAGSLTSAIIQGSASGTIVASVLGGGTVTGNLSGTLMGGKSIGTAVVLGMLAPGAAVTCSLGDIKSLTIKGDVNGTISAPNGAIVALNLSGNVGATGGIAVRSLGALTIPGTISGFITAATSITSIKTGSVATTSTITAASLVSLTTTGDMNGILNVGTSAALLVAVGANFGGQITAAAPLTVNVGGNMLDSAAITDSHNLTALNVLKGTVRGHIIVDRIITAINGSSMADAVIIAGQGLATLKITGAMDRSLVQVGLSRGADNVFGTNDLNEQGRMGDLGTLNVGRMNSSVIAAGGNIGTFAMTGNMSSSIVSTGLVMQGAAVADVLADATPLADAGEMAAALASPTLLHGGFKSVSVGVVNATNTHTVIDSTISAGVSPGADGDFATAADNSVHDSITGGNSSIATFKGALNAGSRLLANTPTATAIPGLTIVKYTTGDGADSILAADPITGAPTATARPGIPALVVTPQGTYTITVTGPADASVQAFDDSLTEDRLDTLLINSASSTPVNVTVTFSNSASFFGIGRVIATDNTQVGSFIAVKGDLLGDAAGGPSLWIDSDMTTFTVHALSTDAAWNGRIGGNVATMTINQLGPGKLRVGGRITTLNIASSTDNPLLQQLGQVPQGTAVTQVAYSPTTANGFNAGEVFASDGTNLYNVDVLTGTIISTNAIHLPLNNAPVILSGMAFDANGYLYGVATLNNQNPVNQIGQITTTGDQLRCLAASPDGQIFAIDSLSGLDKLVTIDPTTGAATLVGTDGIIRTSAFQPFTAGSIVALAFDHNGNLLAITNDRDGTNASLTTADGFGLGKINYTTSSILRLSSALTNNLTGDSLLINSAVNSISSMAVNAGGNIYIVEDLAGGAQQLDRLNVSATGGTLNNLGTIQLDGSDSQLIGVGFDETDTLIGMNRNAFSSETSELVGINIADPTQSVFFDAPGLINQPLAGFAVGKSGTNYATYAFTTNATTGGTFFMNPGVVSTLGTIGVDGAFTQLLPLARNATGAPLAGNATGLAVDAAGDIFAITDQGVLAKYSSANGAIIGGQPIGVVKYADGVALNITRITFDASGNLVGLSATGNNLVRIQQTTTVVNGENVALASDITEKGTANAADLAGMSFDANLNQILSFSADSECFVGIGSASPEALGGILANSIGTAALPNSFSGHIGVTGGGGVTVNGIDTIKFTGTAGTFTGSVSAVNSIGALTGTGVTFNGSLATNADLNAVTLTGAIGPSGVIAADGKLNTFSLTGDFAGRISMRHGVTFTVKGNVLDTAVIHAQYDLGTVSISGSNAGDISLGSNKTFTLTGTLSATATVAILGAAGAVTLNGGTDLGSLFWANQGATSLTVGGTLKGVVAARLSVATVKLNNVTDGIFNVGGDLNSLTVTGTVSHSILSIGTWVGTDGIYNTADDVIYGGSLLAAKFSGAFIDSVVSAGVLPRAGVEASTNNIPLNFGWFDYNASANTLDTIDSAEAGGIRMSYIQNVTFAKPVVSNAPDVGVFSALVAANGISKIGTANNILALRQIVRTEVPGAPVVVNSTDPITNMPVPGLRVGLGEIWIVFSKPLDTATLNNSTIHVADSATGQAITDLTFGYERRTLSNGIVQSLLKIYSSGRFNGASGVTVTFADGTTLPWITDGTGSRSALLDYNQDGILESDPFGTTFMGDELVIGPPSNDNFADAMVLTGTEVAIHGSNVNATVETNETSYTSTSGTSSIWYTWTAPVSGAIQIDTIGSDFTASLSVYTATASSFAALTLVGSSYAISGSAVVFSAVADTIYYIQVSGVAQTGNVELNVRVPQPPANDDLANAQVLTGSAVLTTGTTIAASNQVDESTHNGYTATSSVWYSWNPDADVDTSVSAFRGGITTELSVYSGTAADFASLTPIATGEGETTVNFHALAGTTYYIAVDTPIAQSGFTFVLGNPLGVSVADFADPMWAGYNTGGTGDFGNNVRTSLVSFGYGVHPFVGIGATDFDAALTSANVLLIPAQEYGNFAEYMDSAGITVIQDFVANGGGLVINGTSYRVVDSFLNDVFGFAIGDEQLSSSSALFTRTAAAVGTQFADDPLTIPANYYTGALPITSLPEGSTVIYRQGNSNLATVVVIPYGAGRIVYVGWDWYYGAENGWNTVLNSAVLEAAGL